MTNTGWICPNCYRCYAPSVTECRVCNKEDNNEENLSSYCDHTFTCYMKEGFQMMTCRKCGLDIPGLNDKFYKATHWMPLPPIPCDEVDK